MHSLACLQRADRPRTPSCSNILLVFIPISWAAHLAGLSATLTFVFAFLAIVPLASLLSFATEEMALRVGQTLGGLLNATLGNVTELIVAILALVKCELRIVQSSLGASAMWRHGRASTSVSSLTPLPPTFPHLPSLARQSVRSSRMRSSSWDAASSTVERATRSRPS